MPVAWDDFEAVDQPPKAKGTDWTEFEPEYVAPSLPAPPDWYQKLSPAEKEDYGQTAQAMLPESPAATIGKGAKLAGEKLKNAAGAYAFEAVGDTEDQAKQLGVDDDTLRKLGMLTEPSEPGVTPLEQGQEALPTPARVLSKGAYGLVETVPKLAGVAGAEAMGIPAPIAAGAVFGSTPEGFNPKEAAVAAALPFVGKYSGEIVGAIARKFGVDGAQALRMWKSAGALTGAAGYLGAIDESEIQNLPPEQRDKARIEMVAGLMGQSLLGPMGVEKPTAGEVAGMQLGKNVRNVPLPESLIAFGETKPGQAREVVPPDATEPGAAPEAKPVEPPAAPTAMPTPKAEVPLEHPAGFGEKSVPEGMEQLYNLPNQPAPEGLTLAEFTKESANPLNKRLGAITDGKANGTIAAYWAAVNDVRDAADPLAKVKEWGDAAEPLQQKGRELRQQAEDTGNMDYLMKSQEPSHAGGLIKEGLEAIANWGKSYGFGNDVINAARREVARLSPKPEDVTPLKTEAPAPSEVKDALSGAGRGVVGGLYDSMFERLKAGKRPEPFAADKQSAFAKQAKAAYDAGEVKSAADLQKLANPPKEAEPQAAPTADDYYAKHTYDAELQKAAHDAFHSTPLEERQRKPNHTLKQVDYYLSSRHGRAGDVHLQDFVTEHRFGRGDEMLKEFSPLDLADIRDRILQRSKAVRAAQRLGLKFNDPINIHEAEIVADHISTALRIAAKAKEGPDIGWPKFLTDYWSNAKTDLSVEGEPASMAGTAFQPYRLRLMAHTQSNVQRIVADAVKRGVPAEFIINKSKSTNPDYAIKEIEQHPGNELAPAKESNPATTGPTTAENVSREEIGNRPGATKKLDPERATAKGWMEQDKELLKNGKWLTGLPLSEASRTELEAKVKEYEDFVSGKTKEFPTSLDQGKMIKRDTKPVAKPPGDEPLGSHAGEDVDVLPVAKGAKGLEAQRAQLRRLLHQIELREQNDETPSDVLDQDEERKKVLRQRLGEIEEQMLTGLAPKKRVAPKLNKEQLRAKTEMDYENAIVTSRVWPDGTPVSLEGRTVLRQRAQHYGEFISGRSSDMPEPLPMEQMLENDREEAERVQAQEAKQAARIAKEGSILPERPRTRPPAKEKSAPKYERPEPEAEAETVKPGDDPEAEAEAEAEPYEEPVIPKGPPIGDGPYAQLEGNLAAARAQVVKAKQAHMAAMEAEMKADAAHEKVKHAAEGIAAYKKLTQAKVKTTRAESAVRTAESEASLARYDRMAAEFRGREPKPGKPKITGKMLKEQKDNLLSQLESAIKAAPEDGSEPITFKVPGDGEFTVTNNKAHLKRFRDGTLKGFPTTVGGASMPGLPSVNAKTVPKVAEPKAADLGKIAANFVSDDPQRFVLRKSYADGTQIVATDGRQLIRIVTDEAPGTPDKPVRLNDKGAVDEDAALNGNYPNWAAVRDPDARLIYGGMDTADVYHIARQGEIFRNTSQPDRSQRNGMGLELWVNPDRSIGGTGEFNGDAFEHNKQPGALSLGKYNPDLILAAMDAARKLGNAKVDVYAHSGASGPLGFVGKNHENLMMGIGGGGEAPKRAESNQFKPGAPVHGMLPKGLGPMEHPESERLSYASTDSGKFQLSLKDGKIELRKQVDRGRDARGRSIVDMEAVSDFDLKDWPEGAKAQIAKVNETWGKNFKENDKTAASKVRDEIQKVVKEREGLIAEGERRKAMTEKGKGPGMIGMGGAMNEEFRQTPPTIEDQISGKLAPPRPREPVPTEPAATPVLNSWQAGFNNFKERVQGTLGGFAGKTFPRTTLKARHLGELGARWISSRIAAKPTAEVFAAEVLGNSGVDPVHFGAALTEDNLRSIKQAFLDKADEAENRDEIMDDIRGQMPEVAERAADGDPEARKELSQMRREITRLSKLTDEDVEKFTGQAQQVNSFIGAEGFPFKTEDEYSKFLDDPHVKEALARHRDLWDNVVDPQYRQAMMIDPDFELPSRGLETGARINLRAVIEGEPARDIVGGVGRGNLLGTLRKKSPFGIQAKGTGEAYHLNYYDLMENTFARQLEIANKNEFETALVKAKQAVIGEPGQQVNIDGQPAVEFPLKRQRAIIPGAGAVSQNKSIYVNKKLAQEYRIGANVDGKPPVNVLTRMNTILNTAAISGLTDATVHITNLGSGLATLPGTSGRLLHDSLLSAVPGRPDVWVSVFKALTMGAKDNRAQLASLAEIGALREGRFQVEKSKPKTWIHAGSDVIRWMDQNTRLVLDNAFKNLAKDGLVENTETNRREFINQMGQYNKRAQGYYKRWFRDTGFGPFVTAGTTFNTLGVRGITLNPGVKASSGPAALALRVNMLAKLVGTAGTIGVLNYLLTKDKKDGSVLGRPGIPFGAIDLGTNDKNGRPQYLPILGMIGPARGLRVTGARGFIESKLRGLPTAVALDAAERDVINSVVAPFAGPPIRFAALAATGQAPAKGVQRQFPVVPPGQNQAMSDFRNALIEASPVTAGIKKAMEPGSTGWSEVVKSQLPRFTLQPGKPPEMMRDYPGVVRRAQANGYIEDVIGRARKMEPGVRKQYLIDSVSRLESMQDRQKAIQQFKYRKVL